MMEEYYRLLGLSEGATDEEITARYEEMLEKCKEDRWLDGEAGNQAAKLMTKLQTAYKELMAARKEQRAKGADGASAIEEVSKCLHANNLAKAQELLDSFNERGAEWHYLQAVVFYKKNWYNESKKQLEIAMQIDPNNAKYREAYQKLGEKNNYQKQSAGGASPYDNHEGAREHQTGGEQMGGEGACNTCCSCCYAYMCADCLFSCCCR
ncbi:MAG: J domain-containing protein [Clostridia bacterium]|nr:J domain-containing protein [Clostridia bacterium]